MTRPKDPLRPAATAPPSVRPYLRDHGRRPVKGVGGEAGTRPGLRPFVLTSGRVVAVDPDIGMETQVTSRPGTAVGGLGPELRAIVTLCAQPLSVAEVSANLGLHLGVTRVLVGDLRAAGHVAVHVRRPGSHDPETIARVIRALRALS